jgi:hypothetical protein
MVYGRVAAFAGIAVMIQSEVVLRVATITDVVQLQRVYILVGTILKMGDAAIVPKANPAERSWDIGTSASPQIVRDGEVGAVNKLEEVM